MAKSTTWVFGTAVVGAMALLLRRRRAAATTNGPDGSEGDGGTRSRGPKVAHWCNGGVVPPKDVGNVVGSVVLAAKKRGWEPGAWGSPTSENPSADVERLRDWAFVVTNDALAKHCPGLELPAKRSQLDNFVAKYGQAWRKTYSMLADHAWAYLLPMERGPE